MPKKPSQKKVEAAIEQLDKVRNEWLRRPNVTAVDVGFKIKDEEITDQIAIRAHVVRKLPLESLESFEVLSVSGDPHTVGEFPVDVIEAVYGPAQVPALALEPEAVDRRSRVDPLAGGVSCGNPRVTAGTLGAIVFDRNDCKPCILSNWHVLVGSPAAAAGEPIYQPGRVDGGGPADTVASLTRWRLDRDMDAALARLDGSRGHTRDILELPAPIAGVEEPALGMQVVKSGRTTGVTEGLIDGVSTSLSISYGGGVVQMFHDQIHIVPRPPWPAVPYELSLGGDSGSVWINQATSRAVGLHFAGETDPSPAAENAIANRMPVVADTLRFSFTPLFCLAPLPFDFGDLRLILRRSLCQRYPWLCEPVFRVPRIPIPIPDPGPFAFDPQGAQAPAGSCCGRAAGGASEIDAVLDEVLEELRRSR